MRRSAFVTSLLVALSLAPCADAKTFVKLVVVGGRGTAIQLRGAELAPWQLLPGAQVTAQGPYLLLYPIFDRNLPGQPGRYYPEARVACLSWDRSVQGDCEEVSDAFAARLEAAAGLVRFTGEPTTLARLVMGGQERRLASNGAVGIELAFNRWRLARLTKKPAFCTAVRAAWRGPAASSRPTSFCIAAQGVWARGRLYPMPGLRGL